MISWFISYKLDICITFLILNYSKNWKPLHFDSWRDPFDQRAFASGFTLRFLKLSIFKSLGFKNLSRGPEKVRTDALNRRSSRLLRHIKVEAYLYLVVVFFTPQKWPHLLDSNFQVGLSTHRVNPGVSGWVCKLW